MGRGYIVDDAVKEYLSKLCDQHASPVTGLLIGQVKSCIVFFSASHLMCLIRSIIIHVTFDGRFNNSE